MTVAWLSAFAFTQAVEIPIYAFALGRHARPRGALLRVVLAFAASAITHPFVWFAFPALLGFEPYLRYVLVAELFAWSVEALWLRALGVGWGRAIAWAFLANALSLGVGLASRTLFGWP